MTDQPANHDPYAQFAGFYDLEYADFDADLDFYRTFALRANGSILELGCGTGRVLLALEDIGLPLTGVDSSASMLDIARREVRETTVLVKCDIVDLATCAGLPDRPYWMVFSAINQLSSSSRPRGTSRGVARRPVGDSHRRPAS